MTKKYTEEHRQFLRDFIPGHSCIEVSEEFNRRFEIKITPSQVHSYKTNHHIKSGTKGGSPKGESDLFPRNVRDFIRANNHGKTALEMAELLNRTFGADYSVGQIKAIRSRMHIKSGLSGHFEKGHVPANKGKKGVCGKGCEKTWFKKGHIPYNKCRVGDEAWTTDGYLKVKIAEPNIWRHKHIIEWEKHRGKVPEGCMISFKDGNHNNCSIENLMCITQTENGILNSKKLRFDTPELTETGLAIAKVMHKVGQLSKERK